MCAQLWIRGVAFRLEFSAEIHSSPDHFHNAFRLNDVENHIKLNTASENW